MADIGSHAACWPVQSGHDKDGYGVLRVDGRKERAHRVMFSLYYPGVNAPVVRHNCHNPACINPAHLRPGTPLDNAIDRMLADRGGNLKGENNGRAKLSESDVLEIRASSLSGADLGRKFGISKVMACRIRRGEAWTHVKSGEGNAIH
jgi:hypothetical protein